MNLKFKHIDAEIDPSSRTLQARFRRSSPACFTTEVLADLNTMCARIREEYEDKGALPFTHLIVGSNNDFFQLGGALDLFVRCVEQGDRASLLEYAYACTRALNFGSNACQDIPLITSYRRKLWI